MPCILPFCIYLSFLEFRASDQFEPQKDSTLDFFVHLEKIEFFKILACYFNNFEHNYKYLGNYV